MALKILCAGFGKDERTSFESQVRSVLGARVEDGSWTVSLVKAGPRLAVTVDGPDERLRSKTFMAEPVELERSLLDLLVRNGFGAAGPAPAAAGPVGSSSGSFATPRQPPAPVGSSSGSFATPPQPPAPVDPGEDEEWEAPVPGERRDTHRCLSCLKAYVVVYVTVPNEKKEQVSVACPHCWKVDRLEVGETAALAKEFRADKING
jgi:hypothetical protein